MWIEKKHFSSIFLTKWKFICPQYDFLASTRHLNWCQTIVGRNMGAKFPKCSKNKWGQYFKCQDNVILNNGQKGSFSPWLYEVSSQKVLYSSCISSQWGVNGKKVLVMWEAEARLTIWWKPSWDSFDLINRQISQVKPTSY